MKIIDLLNKIANGEYPTVKYRDVKYEYDDTYGDYIIDGEKGAFGLLRGWSLSMILNDEVEIIEEDKKIDTIKWKSCGSNLKELNENIDDLANKINEIIDYINKE